jgi:hypothetical protein
MYVAIFIGFVLGALVIGGYLLAFACAIVAKRYDEALEEARRRAETHRYEGEPEIIVERVRRTEGSVR